MLKNQDLKIKRLINLLLLHVYIGNSIYSLTTPCIIDYSRIRIILEQITATTTCNYMT